MGGRWAGRQASLGVLHSASQPTPAAWLCDNVANGNRFHNCEPAGWCLRQPRAQCLWGCRTASHAAPLLTSSALSRLTNQPLHPPSLYHPPSQLLGYIKKDKQGDSLIDKLCQRFAASDDPAQWHSIAFCLTQVRLPACRFEILYFSACLPCAAPDHCLLGCYLSVELIWCLLHIMAVWVLRASRSTCWLARFPQRRGLLS